MVRRDPLLERLLEADDDASRQEALAAVLGQVAPLIRRLLARYRHADGTLQAADADDIASSVTFRLLRRLQRSGDDEDEPIERLEDYVAIQIQNAVYDLMRCRFPERTRLKNRLRYILSRDDRLALWHSPSGLAAGVNRFANTIPSETELQPHASAGGIRSAEAVHHVLARHGRPVLFEQLVRFFAELWNVADSPIDAPAPASDTEPRQHTQLEEREYLKTLWSEILLLRAPQRTALLLNSRDVEGISTAVQFVLLGITTIDELADALELAPERLAELWGTLPLDDVAIGEMLDLRRQQVIDLRRSARTRLARRMMRNRDR